MLQLYIDRHFLLFPLIENVALFFILFLQFAFIWLYTVFLHILDFLQDVLSEEEVAELEKEYMKFLRHEIHVEGRDFCDMSSDYHTKSLEEYSIINIMLPSRYVLYVMISCCVVHIHYSLLSIHVFPSLIFKFCFLSKFVLLKVPICCL